jgi:hypothetical protein
VSRAWLLVMAMLVSACAGTVGPQHYALDSNRADDAYCVKQGVRYPDADYVQCRRALQDAQRYRQWKAHQMVQGGTNPASPASAKPAASPMSGYQPLDAQEFQCHLEAEYGGNLVVCGVRPPPR